MEDRNIMFGLNKGWYSSCLSILQVCANGYHFSFQQRNGEQTEISHFFGKVKLDIRLNKFLFKENAFEFASHNHCENQGMKESLPVPCSVIRR